MIRILALAALVALAGCIEMPDDAGAFEPAAAPEGERIAGMTADETHEDRAVDCNDGGGGGIQLPPRFCAERVVHVTGRIGLDRLPVDLDGDNGQILIGRSQGDAWSFEATVRVSALTQEQARDALDTAWSWSHEENAQHKLRAGPTPVAPVEVTDLGSSQVVASTYRVTLPAWVELDVHAETDNGAIAVHGFAMGAVDAQTDNGAIVLAGSARDVKAQTDNGQITLAVTPRGGAFDLQTDNGAIDVEVPVGAQFGYDVEATTDNGRIRIDLDDGDLHEDEDGATFVTDGYTERAVRTTIRAATDNGGIRIHS